MKRPGLILSTLALALLMAGTGVDGAEPAELRKLFPNEAEVFVERTGLSNLVLPAEVLIACRPDLSDLRLFDGDGREVPFMVDAGRLRAPTRDSVEMIFEQSHELPVVEAARSETRREDGPPLRRETFELDMPDDSPPTGNWVLVVETRPAEFVARLQLESIGVDGVTAAIDTDGSIFRLRGARSIEKLRVPLPPLSVPRLRVVLETEHSFWLEPAFRLESARKLEGGGRVAVPLEVLSSRGADGRTIVDLSRPRGIAPDLLRIETTTGIFDREVVVWDQGPASADEPLGSGRIFRVEALVPVGEQEVTLHSARGDRLRIEIDDGDSPALEKARFAAVIRQPSMIFSITTDGSDEVAGVLRFGGGRAHAPRYDLATLLPVRTTQGKRAEVAALLYDPASVRPARLGPTRRNTTYDGAPALGFAMHAGSAIDRRAFSHLRTLLVPAAAEGLSRLRLGPEDLAVLSDDLSDLRVADDDSNQWSYLLEREAVAEFVLLEVEDPEQDDGESSYVLRAPVWPLRFDRILLDTEAGFFDREFRLEAELAGNGEEKTLARGRLTRPLGDPRAVGIDVSPVRVESVRLFVVDGDDAPLAFRSIRARVMLPELYLTAPAGRYSLLLGAPDANAPRYELERVRDVVLAVNSATIAVGPLERNADFSLQARLKGRGFSQQVLLWVVLIVAVLILVYLTLRLARRESPGS